MALLLTVLLLGVVLIRLAWQLRKARKAGVKPPSNALVLSLSVLAIVLSGILISKEMARMAPYVYDPAADQALGRSLTAYFLPDAEAEPSVVIISQGWVTDDGMYENRASKARLEAFIEEMKTQGYGNPTVVSPLAVLRKLEGDRDGKAEDFMDEYWLIDSSLPAKVLTHVWETYPEADVVISLDGAPRGDRNELKSLKPEGSRFYALDLWEIEYVRVDLKDGLVDGIVTYRMDPDWNTSADDDPFAFDNRYVFVKAE